jgi:hypothetical protein
MSGHLRAAGAGAATAPPTATPRWGMEELRFTNLLGGALAAVSSAVVASFYGVFGTSPARQS